MLPHVHRKCFTHTCLKLTSKLYFSLHENDQKRLFYTDKYFLVTFPLQTLSFILMYHYHHGIWTLEAMSNNSLGLCASESDDLLINFNFSTLTIATYQFSYGFCDRSPSIYSQTMSIFSLLQCH